MASISKRKNKNGTHHWRAVVRIKGYPTVCNHFDRKQEAEDWAKDIERQIKLGQYNPEKTNVSNGFNQLIERFLQSGALEHHKSSRDTLRHLNYWKERFKDYAIVHITSELIGKERKLLQDTPSTRGLRSPATVNRYLATLSLLFTYAQKELRWVTENPCFTLTKLKEAPGRDRILSSDEIVRLLDACQKSRSTYLYCIVIMALTTGMRQGEILGLTWQQIDLEQGVAHLRETKNGRPRSVPLVDEVVQELQKFYQKRNVLKPLIFASKTAFGKLDINKAWKTALKRAQITSLRFHDMRHTFATLAARQGASNIELATAMGHKTLQMLQRYTHLEATATRKFSESIADNHVFRSA